MYRTRHVLSGVLACFTLALVTSALLGQDGRPARLKVFVPTGAVLEIEGVKIQSKQTGDVRFFVSPPLAPGKNYTYTIKATWKDAEGKDVTKEETVKVQPGLEATADLRPAGASKPVAEEKKPA